ncbi:MAG: DNA mismatch repair endonuclease MutL [Christensenellaceae bacterium]|nr:MAG: DNA mismatch repair endonuclease MutL [Clostridiales bacterium]
MSKINILSAQVYNRIAAGEVVDRPYSVVKELVENAIDAGATEIEIYVEGGGKQLIRVVDNGGGISRDDLHAAFLPHATSKIAKADDLERIMTLGFRGEAVASIAAVSKMTITSKVSGENCYRLTSDGGKLGEIVEAAGGDGTDVSVEMLFFNTPVRLGFLKSDKSEETDITNFVSRFILNRPDISFRYYVGGKRILQSFGGGEEEAVVGVYGASILKDCYKIDASKHGIRLRGYIGNQNFSKPNKTYQSVFLNGRYIINSTISAAVSNAYASYLMKRQYPFYVLYIDMPTEIVDVNVHPNKADVRFADNQTVYGCIYSVISAVLDGQPKALEYLVSDKTAVASEIDAEPEKVVSPKAAPVSAVPFSAPKKEKPRNAPLNNSAKGVVSFSYEDARRELEKVRPSKTTSMELPFEPEPKAEENAVPVQSVPAEKKSLRETYADLQVEKNILEVNSPEAAPAVKTEGNSKDFFAENKRFLEELETKAKQNKIDVSSCAYAGKLFNTYLLYERGDEVYIIDQHAAHERLIFDRLKEQMRTRKVLQQPMLLPYVLNLNAFESAFIREKMENIREMGFDIDEFGNNAFKVSAVPLDLQSIDLALFFNEILGDISGYRSIKLEDLLKDKLATAACKAAVKGGMDLTREETDRLFRLMDGNMGLKCPHGRPVVVKMTKTELEKMFKRIV